MFASGTELGNARAEARRAGAAERRAARALRQRDGAGKLRLALASVMLGLARRLARGDPTRLEHA
jgi:hypothetical protein